MRKESAIAEFYDGFSARFLRDYIRGNPRIEAQFEFFFDAIPPSSETVLIVGCGNGHVARFVASTAARRARVLALDLSERNIQIATRLFGHPRVDFQTADILAHEIEGAWDVILLPDVYEHIPASSRGRLHERLAAALSPRGRVLITVPSPAQQTMLREAGEGLQIVDETVTVHDLVAMAGSLDAGLTYYAVVSVFRSNDYVHAVIERASNRVESMGPEDRLPIRHQDRRRWARTWRRVRRIAGRPLRGLRAWCLLHAPFGR